MIDDEEHERALAQLIHEHKLKPDPDEVFRQARIAHGSTMAFHLSTNGHPAYQRMSMARVQYDTSQSPDILAYDSTPAPPAAACLLPGGGGGTGKPQGGGSGMDGSVPDAQQHMPIPRTFTIKPRPAFGSVIAPPPTATDASAAGSRRATDDSGDDGGSGGGSDAGGSDGGNCPARPRGASGMLHRVLTRSKSRGRAVTPVEDPDDLEARLVAAAEVEASRKWTVAPYPTRFIMPEEAAAEDAKVVRAAARSELEARAAAGLPIPEPASSLSPQMSQAGRQQERQQAAAAAAVAAVAAEAAISGHSGGGVLPPPLPLPLAGFRPASLGRARRLSAPAELSLSRLNQLQCPCDGGSSPPLSPNPVHTHPAAAAAAAAAAASTQHVPPGSIISYNSVAPTSEPNGSAAAACGSRKPAWEPPPSRCSSRCSTPASACVGGEVPAKEGVRTRFRTQLLALLHLNPSAVRAAHAEAAAKAAAATATDRAARMAGMGTVSRPATPSITVGDTDGGAADGGDVSDAGIVMAVARSGASYSVDSSGKAAMQSGNSLSCMVRPNGISTSGGSGGRVSPVGPRPQQPSPQGLGLRRALLQPQPPQPPQWQSQSQQPKQEGGVIASNPGLRQSPLSPVHGRDYTPPSAVSPAVASSPFPVPPALASSTSVALSRSASPVCSATAGVEGGFVGGASTSSSTTNSMHELSSPFIDPSANSIAATTVAIHSAPYATHPPYDSGPTSAPGGLPIPAAPHHHPPLPPPSNSQLEHLGSLFSAPSGNRGVHGMGPAPQDAEAALDLLARVTHIPVRAAPPQEQVWVVSVQSAAEHEAVQLARSQVRPPYCGSTGRGGSTAGQRACTSFGQGYSLGVGGHTHVPPPRLGSAMKPLANSAVRRASIDCPRGLMHGTGDDGCSPAIAGAGATGVGNTAAETFMGRTRRPSLLELPASGATSACDFSPFTSQSAAAPSVAASQPFSPSTAGLPSFASAGAFPSFPRRAPAMGSETFAHVFSGDPGDGPSTLKDLPGGGIDRERSSSTQQQQQQQSAARRSQQRRGSLDSADRPHWSPVPRRTSITAASLYASPTAAAAAAAATQSARSNLRPLIPPPSPQQQQHRGHQHHHHGNHSQPQPQFPGRHGSITSSAAVYPAVTLPASLMLPSVSHSLPNNTISGYSAQQQQQTYQQHQAQEQQGQDGPGQLPSQTPYTRQAAGNLSFADTSPRREVEPSFMWSAPCEATSGESAGGGTSRRQRFSNLAPSPVTSNSYLTASASAAAVLVTPAGQTSQRPQPLGGLFVGRGGAGGGYGGAHRDDDGDDGGDDGDDGEGAEGGGSKMGREERRGIVGRIKEALHLLRRGD